MREALLFRWPRLDGFFRVLRVDFSRWRKSGMLYYVSRSRDQIKFNKKKTFNLPTGSGLGYHLSVSLQPYSNPLTPIICILAKNFVRPSNFLVHFAVICFDSVNSFLTFATVFHNTDQKVAKSVL